MNKFAVILVIILGTTFFIGGCSQSGQSEQEKYYKQLNEDRKKAEKMNQEAADSMMQMKKAPLYDNAEKTPTSNPSNKNK